MRDNWGDKIVVERDENAAEAVVEFHIDGKVSTMMLTPKKARKFARKLNRVASAIEIDTQGVRANG